MGKKIIPDEPQTSSDEEGEHDASVKEIKEWRAKRKSFDDRELDLFGLRSVLEGGRLFCGVPTAKFPINGVRYQWARGSALTVAISFTRLGSISNMDFKDMVLIATKEITDRIDLPPVTIVTDPNSASVNIVAANLDGPSGVLADCQIPPVNASVGQVKLRMRMDALEGSGWVISDNPQQGYLDAYRVFLHEFEHACGLGHEPANVTAPALIAPTYSRTIRNLQKADLDEFIIRYLARANPLPPPVVPTPGTTPVTFEGVIRQGVDRKYVVPVTICPKG